jgi:hypothetical protein
MPKEIFPSSYVCDCGYESDHFENTIRDLKRLSLTQRRCLGADDGAHRIVFDGGEMAAMWCPKVGKEIPARNASQCTARPRRVPKR